jgi:FixJ family two-component response regulator
MCARARGFHIPGQGKIVANVAITARVVAIVDDDPSMLKGLEGLLRAHGFVTEIYASAEAFLERSATSEASCLILDIHLGGISGIDLRRRLSAAGSRLPVIFMTGGDSEIIKKEAIEAGCIAYLRKPFPSCQLIDAIGRAAS